MSCTKCDLCLNRHNIVYGDGNIKSNIVIIGEAPGLTEDKTGIPFTGKSGKLLRSILLDLGYDMDVLYITNVIKCRPVGNRTPNPNEIDTCIKYFLSKELQLIKPKFIIAAGLIACNSFFMGTAKMNEIVNKIYKINDTYIIPVYHPSYILHSNMIEYYTNRFKEISLFITNNI